MELVERLQQIVGQDNVVTSEVDCLGYARDMSVHFGPPDMVVFPENTEQVSEIMKACNEAKVPVIPRGGGTSVTGAVLAMKGGVLLNLIRMNKILEVNLTDHYVKVEPGLVCGNLNAALAKDNYFFPPDPGSAAIATLGGMINTNASGIRAVKYGTTKDFVMGLKVVLADGSILKTGTIAPKSSSGYDLTQLFCRSEGTLGVITEATLKILPMPEYSISARLEFPSIETAGAAVTEMLTTGIPIATCEILDNVSIEVLKKAISLEAAEGVNCMIMLELDGHRAAVEEYQGKVDTIGKKHSMMFANWTDDMAEKAPLWEARHKLVPAMSRLKPGYRLVPLMEDFGVPLTKIPETINQIQKVGDKYGFPIATFGHIGDGNLHATFIMDVKKKEEWDAVKKIAFELVDITSEMDGTMSAEHGVGMAKAPYIGDEVGDTGIKVMQSIKDALDPNDILNPAKMGLSGSIEDIYARNAFDPLKDGSDQVITFGSEVDNEIVACIQCGFCRLGCPTYGQTDMETLNARGRVSIAFQMLTGKLEPNQEMAERLYQCMLCANCRFTCPASVDVAAIVQAARQRVVEKGYLPEVFKQFMVDTIEKGNPFGEKKETRTDSFPKGFEAKEKAETLLHLGCVGSYQDVKIIPSIIKILEAAGEDFTVLGDDETCCGYVSYLVGDMATFDKAAEINLEKFKKAGIKNLVSTCAGCHKTFGHLYEKHGHADGYKAEHAVELLDRLIQEGKLKFKEGKDLKVAYHDPCDIGRHMGIFEPPRNVIKALPNVELVEFALNRNLAKCCGGGGGVKAFDNELSGDIGFERIKQAIAVGADTVVSACPSCKNSLNQGAARARKEKLGKIKVMDITELVAKRLA
ncbi:FAD-binding and (Fe-S)-binding domain-containing protein [Dethiosulfatarculus sandiegensis]|uniref:D-lactate dehydrogenase (cytochrome) n=1 Tax=Dethiosulfatarculus sandiegensis TaxID=1429043 RepID=A0A0D2JX65_9BACT|nr:FAD-linked oxidase C-terminal domain-containing protein [Dethiosulfatarculus sandiegensis]KIX14180.1 FAD-binding protein [Dethiosulfatarculus sandiegensis]